MRKVPLFSLFIISITGVLSSSQIISDRPSKAPSLIDKVKSENGSYVNLEGILVRIFEVQSSATHNVHDVVGSLFKCLASLAKVFRPENSRAVAQTQKKIAELYYISWLFRSSSSQDDDKDVSGHLDQFKVSLIDLSESIRTLQRLNERTEPYCRFLCKMILVNISLMSFYDRKGSLDSSELGHVDVLLMYWNRVTSLKAEFDDLVGVPSEVATSFELQTMKARKTLQIFGSQMPYQDSWAF